MSNITNREIHVVGIQRTGQHAITSWLIGHFDSVIYKNCMSQKGDRKGKVGIEPPFWEYSKSEEISRDLTNLRLDNSAIILGTEFTIYDVGLNSKILKQKEQYCKELNVEQFSEREDYVLVLRNPFNQYASILNWGRNKLLSSPENFSKMWVKMALECSGETENFKNRTTLIYDDWFEHEDYRRRIEDQLDLPHDDSRLNAVMKIGHGRSWGSSFDGMKSKENAQKMDVLNRWKAVKDDPRFIELCKGRELVQWAEEFGWSCVI